LRSLWIVFLIGVLHTEIAARLSRNHRGGGFAARHVGEPQPLVVVERDG